MNTRPVILVIGFVTAFASTVRADITIDGFTDAGTLPQFFAPGDNTVTDPGLGGVLGGTRSVQVVNGTGANASVEVVNTNPNFNPSITFNGPNAAGSQDLTLGYTPANSDFSNVTSIDFMVDLLDGSISTGTLSINGIDVPFGPLMTGLNTLSIPIVDFAGLTVNDITSIDLTLNGTGSGIDYDVSTITAVETIQGGGGGTPVPEPSTLAACLVVAGLAGVRRRRRTAVEG